MILISILTLITVNVTEYAVMVVIWIVVNIMVVMDVIAMFLANSFRVSSVPIWSTSKELDVVVNVVMDWIKVTEVV